MSDPRFDGPPPIYRGHKQAGYAGIHYGPDDVAVDGDWLADVEDRLAVRDAVIAEVAEAVDPKHWGVIPDEAKDIVRASEIRAILSRVPQGAAEPSKMPTEIDGLHEKYPEVAPFVTLMLRELWANRGKGDQAGWRAMSLRQAWSEIAWHTGKMTTAIKSGDWPLVRELAADIANGAMMLDDIVQRSTEEGNRG